MGQKKTLEGPDPSRIQPVLQRLLENSGAGGLDARVQAVSCFSLASGIAEALNSSDAAAFQKRFNGKQGSFRAQEWLAGRQALAALGQGGEIPVEKGPRPWTSLSHSEGWALAIGAFGPGGLRPASIRGVGVDLELASRPLKPGLASRILGDGERDQGLDPLGLWMAKEALLKAHRKPEGQALISDYHVVAYDPESRVGRGSLRDDQHRLGGSFAIMDTGPWKVVLAVWLF